MELWEALNLKLARQAGIDVPDSRIESVAGKNVLVIRRFDRDGAARISFLSAMSMLGAKENETHSYDGPRLKLEFSRISESRLKTLTLVIDGKHGVDTEVAWCLSKRNTVEDASYARAKAPQ